MPRVATLERILETGLAGAFLAICLFGYSLNIESALQCSDTGWLIATGEYILSHGIPYTDPFSFTAAGKPLVAYQWLFCTALGWLDSVGGLRLVALCSAVVGGTLYLLVLPKMMLTRGVKPAYVFGMLWLALIPCWFWARPQLISFIMIPAFIALLEQFRAKGWSKRLWLLPLLMVLWVNCHTFWFIGLGLVVAYMVPACARDQRVVFLTFACLLAPLLNPYGLALLPYTFAFLTQPDFGSIPELASSVLVQPAQNFHAIVYFLIAWCAIIARRDAVSRQGLVASGFGTLAACMFYRFIPIGILLTWPFAADALAKLFFSQQAQKAHPKPLHPAFAAVGVVLLIAISSQKLPTWFTHDNSDRAAVSFLLQHPDLRKQAFCNAVIGSSQIYTSSAPVFIDTRFDFYGRDFCTAYRSCLNGESGWRKFLSSHDAKTVCIQDTDGLYSRLWYARDWRRVFDDSNCSVWVQNSNRAISER